MSQLQINVNPTIVLDVTVRESDVYTKSVYVKFEHQMESKDIEGCNEMFMTPSQLELIGNFFIRQANEIRSAQLHRDWKG